jgi:hypothetical protein
MSLWRTGIAEPIELSMLAAAGVPFVYQLIRRAGAAWMTAFVAWASAIAVFTLGVVTATHSRWDGLWMVFAVSYLAALYAGAAWPPDAERDEPWRRRVGKPAAFGLLVVGIILSFEAPWKHLDSQTGFETARSAVPVAIVTLLCAALAVTFAVRLWRAGVRHVALWALGAPLAAIAHGLALAGQSDAPWILFNLWLAVAGVASVVNGIRENRFAAANQGLAALALVFGARFFDFELSFLTRGIGFVVLGVACLALNLMLMRRSKGAAVAGNVP